MKEIKFNLDENPFINFLSARYSMSAKINVGKLWKWCHENNKSFFYHESWLFNECYKFSSRT